MSIRLLRFCPSDLWELTKSPMASIADDEKNTRRQLKETTDIVTYKP